MIEGSRSANSGSSGSIRSQAPDRFGRSSSNRSFGVDRGKSSARTTIIQPSNRLPNLGSGSAGKSTFERIRELGRSGGQGAGATDLRNLRGQLPRVVTPDGASTRSLRSTANKPLILRKPGSADTPGKTLPGKSLRLVGPKAKIARDPIRIGKNGKAIDVTKSRAATVTVRNVKVADRLKTGNLDGLLRTSAAGKLKLREQYHLHHKGDVARRLHLGKDIYAHGGWRKHRVSGHVAHSYAHAHFGGWYPGPRLYPSYCWYPRWRPWVNWCWWDYCVSPYDPRPWHCRPIVYDPCATWVFCQYPVWQPLYQVDCGVWLDVPPVEVGEELDVQLLAVRFVDPGHPEKDLGPRYRLWLRNNSQVDIDQPFNVVILASNDDRPAEGLPEAGVVVDSIEAGETQTIDLRLPIAANRLGRNAEGKEVPFAFLHAIVDSHQDLDETIEENNGAILPRGEILPVDPAAFAADVGRAPAGQVISIAGEGLGPEPGKVLVYVKDLDLLAEIEGWFDLGVRIKLPDLPLAEAAPAEIVIIRGDGAATNPLPFMLLPAGSPDVPAPVEP